MQTLVKRVMLLFRASMFLGLSCALAQDVSPPRVASTPPAQRPLPSGQTERRLTVTFKNGRLTVEAQNHSFEDLADVITQKAHVAVILDDGIGKQPINLSFQDLSVDEALREILKDHDAFFFYGVEKQGTASLRAVWVYPKGRGRSLMPVPPEKWASSAELRKMLADPDPEVRSQAILSLIEREGNRAQNEVLDALKDTDDRVRFRTMDKVVKARVALPPSALENLLQQDSSPVVRFLALNAIAEQPGAEGQDVKAFAEFALNDPDENIRNQAREILDQMESAERPPDQHEGSQQQQQQPGQEPQ